MLLNRNQKRKFKKVTKQNDTQKIQTVHTVAGQTKDNSRAYANTKRRPTCTQPVLNASMKARERPGTGSALDPDRRLSPFQDVNLTPDTKHSSFPLSLLTHAHNLTWRALSGYLLVRKECFY